MSKSAKLLLMCVLVIMSSLLVACKDECETCVPDPFAVQDKDGNWVAKPTPSAQQKAIQNVKTTYDNANKEIGKVVSPNVAPTGKQCIESVGAGNNNKTLNEFAERCGRFGGSVANKDVATLCCYK